MGVEWRCGGYREGLSEVETLGKTPAEGGKNVLAQQPNSGNKQTSTNC